jgi:hypothetical protein
LKHTAKSQVGLPGPSAKGEEGGHAFELHDSSGPLVLEKVFVEYIFLRPPRSREARDIKTQKVGAGDEGGGLADVPPLRIREHVAVFMTGSAPHRGSRYVCSRNANVGVELAVREGPEDLLWVFGRARDRSRLRDGNR